MSLPEPTIVHVPLGGRAYDVMIGPGLIDRAGTIIAERLGNRRIGIVTDANLARTHLDAVVASLAPGHHAGTVILEPGEKTKAFAQLQLVCERLLEMGLERGDLVIAL
ncbi:MAG: hypothetical protein ACOYLX_21015, partial [Burkholderiaceae bacterium]